MQPFDHRSGAHVEVGGARIYYETRGDEKDPPLVLLHGGMGTIEDLNSVVERFDRPFRLIGIDARGHGASTLGTVQLSYQRIAEDVEHVLSQLRIARCSLLGFSDGGIVGYRIAARAKVTIDKLITVGAEWKLEESDEAYGILSKVTPESWAKKFPQTVATYKKLNPEPDYERFAKASLRMWIDLSPDGRPRDMVDAIRAKALLVRGDLDHLVARDNVTTLADRLKDTASLAILPCAGHPAFDDQPEMFMLALNTFFDSQCDSAS